MKSKDLFLSNISHELRTPLNSIIGFTDLLLTQELGPVLSDQQRDFLETVARNGRHLLELINELLDLQRIAAGHMELKPEAVELAALLTETSGSVQAQVQKHRHALVVTPPPPGLRVQADRGRVRQVLLNLLSNAIKFTPDGGRITVAAGPVNGGSEIRIAVTDTGIGIATEDQPKLFLEFSQLDASASRKYEGTGLGTGTVAAVESSCTAAPSASRARWEKAARSGSLCRRHGECGDHHHRRRSTGQSEALEHPAHR